MKNMMSNFHIRIVLSLSNMLRIDIKRNVDVNRLLRNLRFTSLHLSYSN